MTDREIDLLDHELLLRGINMNIPASVFHMDLDKALSVLTCTQGSLSAKRLTLTTRM